MGMNEEPDNAARERQEIVTRLASFKATQEKFEREREAYFTTTLENARHSDGPRHGLERPSLWSEEIEPQTSPDEKWIASLGVSQWQA
jgi:hypothetical protein